MTYGFSSCKIESSIEKLSGATSGTEAFNRFSDIAKDFGYDKVVYTLLTDHPSLGLDSKHGLVASYPCDWMSHYKEKNLLSIDPVHLQVLTSPIPFFWSDLPHIRNLPTPSINLMNQAQEAGLKDGLGVPLYGLMGEIAGIGFARDEGEKGQNYDDLAALSFLATYFHQMYWQPLYWQPSN